MRVLSPYRPFMLAAQLLRLNVASRPVPACGQARGSRRDAVTEADCICHDGEERRARGPPGSEATLAQVSAGSESLRPAAWAQQTGT